MQTRVLRCVGALLLGWATPGSLAGEAGATPRIRVLPVGDPPPFRQQIRDGVRQQLDPEPGSTPPTQVRVEKDEGGAVRLNLGTLSAPLLLPKDDAGRFSLRADEVAKPWVASARPSGPSATLVVWRDPSPASWEEPRSLLVPDDPERFPSGQAIVINLLPLPLAVRGGGGDEVLPPGGTCLRRLPAGDGEILRFAHGGSDGAWLKLPDHYLEPGVGLREWIVVFRADQPGSRRAVGRVSMREAVPEEP